MSNARILFQGGTPNTIRVDSDEALFARIKQRVQGRTIPQFVANVLIPAQSDPHQRTAARSAYGYYLGAVQPAARDIDLWRNEIERLERVSLDPMNDQRLRIATRRYERAYSDLLAKINRMIRLWEME